MGETERLHDAGSVAIEVVEPSSPDARLETNGTLIEAIDLYRSAGYEEVPAFNDEPYADHGFEKHLPG